MIITLKQAYDLIKSADIIAIKDSFGHVIEPTFRVRDFKHDPSNVFLTLEWQEDHPIYYYFEFFGGDNVEVERNGNKLILAGIETRRNPRDNVARFLEIELFKKIPISD